MRENVLFRAEATRDVAVAAAAIEALDLGPIKFKLMNDERSAWKLADIERVEHLYRRFLFLIAKYPDHTIVPTKEIDEFWHTHILDTLKYEHDTHAIFGKFLHHFPYFGVRGEEDRARLADAFARTVDLYASEFGDCEPEYFASGSGSGFGVICGGACDHINGLAVEAFGALSASHAFAVERPTFQ